MCLFPSLLQYCHHFPILLDYSLWTHWRKISIHQYSLSWSILVDCSGMCWVIWTCISIFLPINHLLYNWSKQKRGLPSSFLTSQIKYHLSLAICFRHNSCDRRIVATPEIIHRSRIIQIEQDAFRNVCV